MTDMARTIKNPNGESENGTDTFMPQKEAKRAGTDSSTVRLVSTYMTMLRLLLMMEA